jgi:hypothetical protein
MKKIVIYLLLLTCTSAYSQQLSQGAINELSNKAAAFLGVEQSPKVRAAVNRYIATYSSAGPAAAMAGLKSELKSRPDLLMLLDRGTRDRESLVMTCNAINVNPRYIPEIADYFFPRHVVAQKPTTKETTPVAKQAPVKENTEPIVWLPPSKKFVDGRKTFCDSSGTWHYAMIVIRTNVLFLKYPGRPGKDNISAPTLRFQASINGENIVTTDNDPTDYKYENNILYERDLGSDRWTKYVECMEE